MAERRMFAKTIIDSDAFLDMPLSTQALYFHLSMRADDEGFVNNPKKIARMIGADDDSLKLLIMKKFIIPFESGVVVIKHWRIHNYIQKDRFKETVYKDERSQITIKSNGAYTQKQPQYQELLDEPEKTLRQKAYEESELPYSFDYKIRQAFVGRKCPICGCTLSYANNLVAPSIQHNIPISKGGKHELGNISVICISCNKSIQDNETGDLNAKEVIEEWEKISCTRFVHDLDTQDSIGKDRLGKDRLDNNAAKPQKHKHGEYQHVLLTDDEYKKLISDYGEKVTAEYIKKVDEYCEQSGKRYKNYNLAIRNTFMKRDGVKQKKDFGNSSIDTNELDELFSKL